MNTPACRERGFTLLEVMIAMSILAVGAASILGTFVAAVHWQSMRVENNRITAIYNYAHQHAEVAFNNFDPSKLKPDERPLPKAIVADLTDPTLAMQNPDPLIVEAAGRFPGFKYEVAFEENEFAVQGSSVVIQIKIYGLSGQLAESPLHMKEILTRSGTPIQEWWTSPSKDKQKRKQKEQQGE